MKTDICIFGGGLVGGTLAWLLSRASYTVCIVDPYEYTLNSNDDIYSERSIALSYVSKILLQQMDLWKH